MSGRSWPPAPETGLSRASEGAIMHDDWLTRGVLVRRLLGFAIDILLVAAIGAALWLVLFLFGIVTFGLGMPLLAILPAVPPLYHFGFLASPLSATPGQVLMGLTVRRNRDLGRPDMLEALISVVCFYATLALGVIWLAVALVTTRRRTIHDLLSGLVVVRSEAVPPLTGQDGAWNMRPGGPPPA